jgi:hypothetical protein
LRTHEGRGPARAFTVKRLNEHGRFLEQPLRVSLHIATIVDGGAELRTELLDSAYPDSKMGQ